MMGSPGECSMPCLPLVSSLSAPVSSPLRLAGQHCCKRLLTAPCFWGLTFPSPGSVVSHLPGTWTPHPQCFLTSFPLLSGWKYSIPMNTFRNQSGITLKKQLPLIYKETFLSVPRPLRLFCNLRTRLANRCTQWMEIKHRCSPTQVKALAA